MTIELGVDKGELVLKLCDDGRGFDPAKTNGNTQGHGLESMAGRARSIGAQFNLRSHPGQGTTISLSIPV